MEEAVEALIERFVCPLLPSKRSPLEKPPSLSKQEAVAKQLHAVVLLYNYYHRKHFPGLELLLLDSFCKVASIANPCLLSYMKCMHGPPQISGDVEEQYSVTEKMVKDACDICIWLDATKKNPNIEGWPVGKVAFLLIDQPVENCFLQFGSVIQGVWSVLEIENNTSRKGESTKNQPRGNQHCFAENDLPHIACAALKEKIGIKDMEMTIMGQGRTYSLSQQKMAVQFYIIKLTGISTLSSTVVGLKKTPTKCLIDSLQGPVLTNCQEVTTAAEYFLMLPYAEILSDWLLRYSNGSASEMKVDLGVDVSNSYKSQIDNVIRENITNTVHESNKQDISTMDENKGNISKKIKESKSSSVKLEDPSFDIGQKVELSHEKYISSKTEKVTQKKECSNQSEVYGEKGDISGRKIIKTEKSNVKINGSDRRSTKASTMGLCTNAKEYSANNLHLKHSRESHPTVKSGKHTDKMCKKQKSSIECGKNLNQDNSATYNGVAVAGNAMEDKLHMIGEGAKQLVSTKNEVCGSSGQLVCAPLPSANQDYNSFKDKMELQKTEIVQSTLRAFQKRRDELHHQLCQLEEEFAKCEMDIQTILTAASENTDTNFSSMIEAIKTLSANSCPTKTQLRIKKLSEAVLTLQTACQDLDNICRKNNWSLPRYRVFPSTENGGFQANIILQGPDFEFNESGDHMKSPFKARESAATKMLSTLRSCP